MSDTTYNPRAKTKYFVSQHEVENWVEEQYDVSFSVPADLTSSVAPDSDYSVSAKNGILDEYEQKKLNEFLDDPSSENHITSALIRKLAEDGHIPEGEYVISISY
jgi:hypothetical protein